MFVSDILMHKGDRIVSVAPGDSLVSAIATLSTRRIGAVLVLDRAEAPVGILSERDVLHAVADEGAGALAGRVADVMSSPVVCCDRDDTVERAMELMTEGRFRHLPVLSGGALVGLISIGDVVKWRLSEIRQEADDLRQYIAAA